MNWIKRVWLPYLERSLGSQSEFP